MPTAYRFGSRALSTSPECSYHQSAAQIYSTKRQCSIQNCLSQEVSISSQAVLSIPLNNGEFSFLSCALKKLGPLLFKEEQMIRTQPNWQQFHFPPFGGICRMKCFTSFTNKTINLLEIVTHSSLILNRLVQRFTSVEQ